MFPIIHKAIRICIIESPYGLHYNGSQSRMACADPILKLQHTRPCYITCRSFLRMLGIAQTRAQPLQCDFEKYFNVYSWFVVSVSSILLRAFPWSHQILQCSLTYSSFNVHFLACASLSVLKATYDFIHVGFCLNEGTS